MQAKTQGIINLALKSKPISALLLQRIYAMQVKNWADGTPVRVFVLPSNHLLHRQFIIDNFAMAPHQFDRLWNRLLFSGTGRGPQLVASQQEMIAKINSTIGTIGYIEKKPPLPLALKTNYTGYLM